MQILAIPLVTALVGWGTNAIAIKMLFSPLERIGWTAFGWQGVLPANAERMATICVRLMTSKLLDIDAVFSRIKPERIAALLSPALEKNAEEIQHDSFVGSMLQKCNIDLSDRIRETVVNCCVYSSFLISYCLL